MSSHDVPQQSAVVTPVDYGQIRWSGEFADARAEQAFLANIAGAETRAFLFALYVTAPLYFSFVISDYLELGISPAFWLNFSLRLGVALLCLGLALDLRRRPPSTERVYHWSLGFFLTVFTFSLLIYPVSQRDFHEIYPGVLVMMVGAFFFVPSRLRYRVTASAYAILGTAVEAIFFYPPSSHDIPLAIIFSLVILAFGVLASRQHERLRRQWFADAERNRELSALLRQEVAIRHQLVEEATRQARTDELTGLPNRRCFFEQARREIQRSKRYGQWVGLLMFDLDYFKRINDENGHAVGDEVLRETARRCRQLLRSNDLSARIGGEEFAVLLPETGLGGALVFAERLRHTIAGEPIDVDGMPFSLTVTVGVAALGPDERVTLDAFLGCADQALYRGKAQGRNQVVAAESSCRASSAQV